MIMNNNPEQFTPTEIWTPDLESDFDRIRREVNSEDPEVLLSSLMKKVEQTDNGIVYAVLDGNTPGEYSITDALVIFNTFAAGATPIALAKAEIIRRVAKEAGIRDAEGKLKPVIMLANPNIINGSKFALSKEEKKEVKAGDLGSIASELLRAVEQKDIGKIAIFGFSNGADLGLAASRKAYSRNLDIHSTSVGDPASTEARGLPRLVKDFMGAGNKSLKEEMNQSDVVLVDKAFGTGTIDFARFGASNFIPQNVRLALGMGKNTFETRVQEILDDGKVEEGLVIGYGDSSKIAKPENIEPAMQRLYEANGSNAFMSIRFSDSKHTFGDNLEKMAYLVTRATIL